MLKIFINDTEKKRYLQSSLFIPSTDLTIGLNMGGKISDVDILLNSCASTTMCKDRAERRNVFSNYIHVPYADADSHYPLIIKKKKKEQNKQLLTDSVVVECKKEFKVFANIFKNSFVEEIIKPVREYILCATPELVFYTSNLIRKEGYEEVILTNSRSYIENSQFSEPPMWTHIMHTIPKIINDLNLDFGTAKLATYGVLEERYYIFSITPEISYSPECIAAFNAILNNVIEKRINKVKILREKSLSEIKINYE